MTDIIIRINGSRHRAAFKEGETWLDLLRREGIPVNAECGGLGTCGKCRITLVQGSRRRCILACRETVDPAWKAEVETVPENPEQAVLPPADTYTAAVDLGTSTVAVRVFPENSPESGLVCTQWNAQRTYGADVITRIRYIQDHPEGLQDLSLILWRQIRKMAESMMPRGTMPARYFLAGNTVMQHIAAGLSPVSIAQAPFRPETLFAQDCFLPAPETGTPVWYAPCAASYVGGDITAGLYASGLTARPGTFLFLDVGTNGEMALIHNGSVTCCAAATGPAFEGSGIACGMTGINGAISHVRWDGHAWQTDVIGGGPARGLCGSGLLELLALLVRFRIISGTGRLLPPDELPLPWSQFVTEDENGAAVFHLTKEVFLTADDVHRLQLAKAAVAAGIDVLLQTCRTAPQQIEETVLAGGFGTHLDPHSAVLTGMLPPALERSAHAAGNTSLAGITAAAADPQARIALDAIRRKCIYLELSGSSLFTRCYMEHMGFYEEEDDDE